MPRKSIATGPNKGIKYEVRINNILKGKNLQLLTTQSAGASDAPDGFFWSKKERYPLEIKRKNADFAQIELRWDKEKRFYYSRRSKNIEFANFLKGQTKFLERINNEWIKAPKKFISNRLTKEDRHWDLDHFADIKKSINVSFIERFYNSKYPPVYYIQIEGRGFFYLGKDIANLGVSKINGKPYLRARVKTRSASKNRWGFLVAIKMPGIKESKYDLEELDNRIFPIPQGNNINEVQKRIDDFC